MRKKNRKDLTEDLTYRHCEVQEEAIELEQGLANERTTVEVWRNDDSMSCSASIRPKDA